MKSQKIIAAAAAAVMAFGFGAVLPTRGDSSFAISASAESTEVTFEFKDPSDVETFDYVFGPPYSQKTQKGIHQPTNYPVCEDPSLTSYFIAYHGDLAQAFYTNAPYVVVERYKGEVSVYDGKSLNFKLPKDESGNVLKDPSGNEYKIVFYKGEYKKSTGEYKWEKTNSNNYQALLNSFKIVDTNIKRGSSGLYLGDVNGDGGVDIEDSVLVINQINGVSVLADDQTKRADVDKNSTVDIEDAVAIINHVNGVKRIK